MTMTNVDPLTIAALVFGVGAMVLAIKRERGRPVQAPVVNREQELLNRVSILERDITALQRMLTEKQNEIDRLTDRIRQLERDVTPAPAAAKPARARKELLAVGLGEDAMLETDLAALRGIAAFQLAVMRNVKRADLEALLERHRANGSPVRLLHLAMHANHAGLAFSDGMADGLWLSRHLAGVEVLVLAGCESDRVADLLNVVPAVVSMRDEIDNRDASIFARAFWAAMGAGQDAQGAFDEALERSPSTVAEMVELHLH